MAQKPMPQPPGGQDQDQGSSMAEEAVQQIQQGFQTLGKMIQAAGDSLDPDDVQLFQQAAQATDNMIQALTSPAEEKGAPPRGPQPKKANSPMPMNANETARPAPQY